MSLVGRGANCALVVSVPGSHINTAAVRSCRIFIGTVIFPNLRWFLLEFGDTLPTMSGAEKRLFLLDAYALIYRAHFAFTKTPRINSKGINTSVSFGFTNTLLEVLQKQKPTQRRGRDRSWTWC
jgi:hypothetical protein